MDHTEPKNLSGLRVLVVEDNPISQRLVGHILTAFQAKVDSALNGRIAVEKVTANVYDVVLMDIMMPELDGYNATRAIRAMDGEYFRNLPILAFSATPDPMEIIACNMTGHVTKSPLNQDELYNTLYPYLKQS